MSPTSTGGFLTFGTMFPIIRYIFLLDFNFPAWDSCNSYHVSSPLHAVTGLTDCYKQPFNHSASIFSIFSARINEIKSLGLQSGCIMSLLKYHPSHEAVN